MLTMRQAISAAAAAASLAVCACERGQSQEDEAANAANAAERQAVPKLPIPVPQPPLGREQLLLAAMRAASDFAAGADDRERQQALADEKFEFRIRFGCEVAGKTGSGGFDWSFDDKTGTLRIRAQPTLSAGDAPVKALAGEAFETVEGVWVRQPWLLSAVCPKREQSTADADSPKSTAPTNEPEAEDSAPATPDARDDVSPSVGIAQFFTATGPRTMRRSGRPYEATKRLETGDKPTGGFDLILSGRLAALPNGRVIACTRSSPGKRPVCIISVEFGKVWIERADTHEQIAQWGAG